MLAADPPVAEIFSKWILEVKPNTPIASQARPRESIFPDIVRESIRTYLPMWDRLSLDDAVDYHYSEIHQGAIRPKDFTLLNPEDRAFVKEVFADNMGAVREIANGKSLWKGELSDDMKRLQYFLKHNYIFCTSHAQFIERAVKDAAFSGQTGAEERRRNELSIIRSHLLEQTISLAQILQVHGEPSSKSHTPQGSKLTATFLNEVELQANIDLTRRSENSRSSPFERESI